MLTFHHVTWLFSWLKETVICYMMEVVDQWMYLNRWAWWWTGPPKRRDWPWYTCDIIWEFLAWFGLAANLTVIGSELPGGVCPFRCLTASSASALLSNRMKATPRDRPRKPKNIKSWGVSRTKSHNWSQDSVTDVSYQRPGPLALWSWWCFHSEWTCPPDPADPLSWVTHWYTDLHLWSCPNSAVRMKPVGGDRSASVPHYHNQTAFRQQ